jgi:hypothetical protein
MTEHFERQIKLLKATIDLYRSRQITLQRLINQIEGLEQVVDDPIWKENLSDAIFTLEQINAFLIESKTHPQSLENKIINTSLAKLDAYIHQFE